jgi:hypothetical protein
MYRPHGRYRYSSGVVSRLSCPCQTTWRLSLLQNWRAALAILISVSPNLPGLINSINPTIKVGGAIHLFDFAWLFGVSFMFVILPFSDVFGIVHGGFVCLLYDLGVVPRTHGHAGRGYSWGCKGWWQLHQQSSQWVYSKPGRREDWCTEYGDTCIDLVSMLLNITVGNLTGPDKCCGGRFGKEFQTAA